MSDNEQPLVRTTVPALLGQHAQIIADLKKLVLSLPGNPLKPEQNAIYADRFDDAVKRLAEYTYTLPASAQIHHAGTAGLFVHSIEVAYQIVEILERNRDTAVDPHQCLRDRFAGLAVGMCHDLGKIFAIEVRAGIDGQYDIWKPHRQSLAMFAAAHDRVPVTFVHRAGRGALHGTATHDMVAPQFFQWIFGQSLPSWLGNTRIGMMQSAYLGACFKERNIFADALYEADSRSATANRIRGDIAHDPAVLTDPKYGSRSLTDDFITAWRRVWTDKRLVFNIATGVVLTGPTHTVLRLPTSPVTTTAFDVVHVTIAEYLRRTNAAESLRAIWDNPSCATTFESDICVQRCSDDDASYHYCVLSSTTAPRSIRHAVQVVNQRGSPETWAGIIFRNDLLWGDIDFSVRVGQFSSPIRFLSPRDRATVTVPAHAYGFNEYEPDTMANSGPPRPDQPAAGSLALDALLDTLDAPSRAIVLQWQSQGASSRPDHAADLAALWKHIIRITGQPATPSGRVLHRLLDQSQHPSVVKLVPTEIMLHLKALELRHGQVEMHAGTTRQPSTSQSPPTADPRSSRRPAAPSRAGLSLDAIIAALHGRIQQATLVDRPFDTALVKACALRIDPQTVGFVYPDGLAALCADQDLPLTQVIYHLGNNPSQVATALGALPGDGGLRRVPMPDSAQVTAPATGRPVAAFPHGALVMCFPAALFAGTHISVPCMPIG